MATIGDENNHRPPTAKARKFFEGLSRRLRGFLIVLLLILIALIIVALVPRSNPEPISTAGSLQGGIRLNFGLSRETITRSLRVDLCPEGSRSTLKECTNNTTTTTTTTAAAAATTTTNEDPRPEVVSAALQGDLLGGEDTQFPAAQVGVSATNVGRSGLLINVNANPNTPDDVVAGTYTGTIIVDRSDKSNVPLAITVSLLPRSGAVALKVALALALGAFAGTLIKWLDESFSPLAALRRRQRRVEIYLREHIRDLPEGVRLRLQDLRQAISSFDAEGVIGTLEQISENQDTLVEFARGVDAINEQIEKQRRLLDDPSASAVMNAIDIQVAFVSELRSRIWPWENAQEVREEVQRAVRRSRELTTAMRHASLTKAPEEQRRLDYIVRRFLRLGEDALGSAIEETQPIEEATRPSRIRRRPLAERAEPGASLAEGTPSPPQPRAPVLEEEPVTHPPEGFPRRTLSIWLLDNAWWITIFIFALVVVFVGFQTQFIDNPVFEGDGADYVALIAWALAVQVAGGTIIDTVGKLRTSRSGS